MANSLDITNDDVRSILLLLRDYWKDLICLIIEMMRFCVLMCSIFMCHFSFSRGICFALVPCSCCVSIVYYVTYYCTIVYATVNDLNKNIFRMKRGMDNWERALETTKDRYSIPKFQELRSTNGLNGTGDFTHPHCQSIAHALGQSSSERSERSVRYEPNFRSERLPYVSERETNVQALKR